MSKIALPLLLLVLYLASADAEFVGGWPVRYRVPFNVTDWTEKYLENFLQVVLNHIPIIGWLDRAFTMHGCNETITRTAMNEAFPPYPRYGLDYKINASVADIEFVNIKFSMYFKPNEEDAKSVMENRGTPMYEFVWTIDKKFNKIHNGTIENCDFLYTMCEKYPLKCLFGNY